MSKIVVTYDTGRVWACDAEPCGDGDAGEVCAAASTVLVDGHGLVYRPSVMSWSTGEWRRPRGIDSEWTRSGTDYISSGERRVEFEGSVRSERVTCTRDYGLSSYVLLTPTQLEGAVSVMVDGVLAFVRKGGVLAPATNDAEGASEDVEMLQDFANLNRPAAGPTVAGMAPQPASRGIEFEPERW